jgi:hypothetical protein
VTVYQENSAFSSTFNLDMVCHFLRLYEKVLDHINSFKPITNATEFSKYISHPVVMLPFITPEIKSKIPDFLVSTSMDDEKGLNMHYLHNFILIRYLLY